MKELFNKLSNVSNFLNEKRYAYLKQGPSNVPKQTNVKETKDLGPPEAKGKTIKQMEAEVDKMLAKIEDKGGAALKPRPGEPAELAIMRQARKERLAKMSPEAKIATYRKMYNALSPADRKLMKLKTPKQYALALRPKKLTPKQRAVALKASARIKKGVKGTADRLLGIKTFGPKEAKRYAEMQKKLMKIPEYRQLLAMIKKPGTKLTRKQLMAKVMALPEVRRIFKIMKGTGKDLLKGSDASLKKALADLDEAYRLQQGKGKPAATKMAGTKARRKRSTR
jgi:hypothetical protein